MTEKERNKRAQVIAGILEEFSSDVMRQVRVGIADCIEDEYELLTNALEYYIWKKKQVTKILNPGD
jgi:hypothetical protein